MKIGKSTVTGSGILLSLLLLRAASHRGHQQLPNVLIITVDTLRADHLGCYGYSLPTSPVVDALAREGVLFLDCHCQIPETNPSLTSLMTGLYPGGHKNLYMRLILPPAYVTLAEEMRDLGFATCAVIGQSNLAPVSGFAQGFQYYFADFPYDDAPGKKAMPTRGTFNPQHEKRAEELVRTALGWLKANQGQRFFMWIHFMDPHAAYDPPPPYDTMFPYGAYPATELKREAIYEQAYMDPRLDIGYYLQRYDGEIRYTDGQVGRLMDGLRNLSLADSTMTIFTADHGEYMGDPDGWGSPYFHHGGTLAEGETRVPLIWVLPARQRLSSPSHIVAGMVDQVDIIPTLFDLLGVPRAPVDGVSRAASILGVPSAPEMDRSFSYSYAMNSASLESGPWKLIYYPPGLIADYYVGRTGFEGLAAGGRTVLFKRSAPGIDVAKENPEVRDDMLRRIRALLRWPAARHKIDRFPTSPSRDDPGSIKSLEALGYL